MEFGILGIECIIIAISVGIIKGSLKWGIAAFIIMVALYLIPFIGGMVSIILSFMEMMIVYDLLKIIVSESVAMFVSLFALLIIMELHRFYSGSLNDELFGYSLIFTESLFTSLAVWLELESVFLACAVFIVLMVFILIPKLRGIGFVGLAIATAAYTFGFLYVTMQYSIVASLAILAYVSYHHYKAYSLLNYGKMWDEKSQDKTESENAYDEEEVIYGQSSYYLSTHIEYKNLLNDPGRYGEYLIYKNLKHYEQSGAKFLFNCYLDKEDSTTEIDVMLICQGGIFVFESKNYSGWIFGNGRSKNWTQTLPVGKGQSKKISFYNPVKQNDTHVRYLKKIIGNDIPVFSIIVFSDKCSLMNVKVSPKNAQVIQCKEVDNIVKSLEEQTKHKLDIRQISELYNGLYPFTQVSNEIKERHIDYIKKNEEDQQGKHDIDHEVNASSCYLVCPRCGSPLIPREAKKGANIGKLFYGCASYPDCHFTISVNTLEEQNKN